MIIYKITNRVNGKVYIGQTTMSLTKRWRYHCTPSSSYCRLLHRAIQKYGRENFTVEQIDVACDRDELDWKETYWISFYDSMNRDKGYNLLSGGRHHEISEETRLKMSVSQKGKTLSDDHRRKIGQSQVGRVQSKETRLKIRNARLGKYAGSDNPRAKRIYCIETDTYFGSIKEAVEYLGCVESTMSRCLKGKLKTCKGYHWRYA